MELGTDYGFTGSGASAFTASLANIHGDTIATVDGNQAQSGSFAYDPFGNLAGVDVTN